MEDGAMRSHDHLLHKRQRDSFAIVSVIWLPYERTTPYQKMLCTVRARYAVSSIRLMGAECTCLRIAVDVYNARNHCAFHTMNDRQLSLMMLIHSLQDGSLVKAETFYSLLQQTFLGNIFRHSSDGSNLTISSTVCIFPKRDDIEEAHKPCQCWSIDSVTSLSSKLKEPVNCQHSVC